MRYILPHLSVAQRGYSSSVDRWEIVNAILYKFKTGVAWYLLPVNSLISSGHIQYGAVFHHFRKWTKDGSWQQVWIKLLGQFKSLLDLSTAQFDGTHTPCQCGGQQVAYQGRKKAKTTNTLWLTDKQGRVVAFCPPLAGNHHDVYQIDQQLASMVDTLQQASISVEGLFINADAGFDSATLRRICHQLGIHLNAPSRANNNQQIEQYNCFDELMYDSRYVVERTNAWMDADRSFIIRYDTTISRWTAWHYIACIKHWINKVIKV